MQKEISFEKLVDFYKEVLSRLTDKRSGSYKSYSMVDVALSAFSVFFMQCPSFLAYQREPVFDSVLGALHVTKHLDKFRFLRDQLPIPLDGTEYFNSENIYCENCSVKKHKNGSITYSHTAITPVIVHPEIRRVISLPPEFVTTQDGHDKQDCENAAANTKFHK